MSKFENDLTTGNVFSKLLFFAIPFFMSSLLQFIYGVADMIILGNFSGANSLSAVNTGSQFMIIITNLATGIATGGTVMIGNYLGANRKDLINKVIGTLLTSLIILGTVLGLLTILFTNPLLALLNVPAEAYKEAQSYLVISSLGILFVYGYNALSAIMRGMGDSKTPLIFVSFSCVVNIILDLILVSYFHKGAGGAAFATIFSQGLSMFLCIFYLRKNHFSFDFKRASFVIDKPILHTLLKVGLPTGIQQVCNNFSFLVLTAMINDFGGISAGAASGVVNKFNAFAILPCIAISSSVSAMISQNMGAQKEDRIKEATKIGFLLGIGICAIVFVIANVFSREIFTLFGGDGEMMEIGLQYIHAFSFEYVGLGFIVGFNAVFIGVGNGYITLLTNLISSFVVRIPVAILLGRILAMGVVGVGYSIPIATIVGSTVAGIFYFSGVWKKNAIKL